MFWTEVLRGKEKEEGELWNVLDWSVGMVGNKRGKKEKNKRKECGYVGGGGKKREKKKRKEKKKEGAHVCGEKKKREKKNIIIFSQYFYNKS